MNLDISQLKKTKRSNLENDYPSAKIVISIPIAIGREILQNAPSSTIIILIKGEIQHHSSSNHDGIPPPTSFGMTKTRLWFVLKRCFR